MAAKKSKSTKRRTRTKDLPTRGKELGKGDQKKVRGGTYQHNQTDLEFLRSPAAPSGDPDRPVIVGQIK
jgi:hypothetical protein